MDIFKDRKVIIVTKHSKESVISPILENELGMNPIVSKDIDTDQFGTFTREIKRKDTQIKTALAKANFGIDNSDCDIAIASEGSFSPSPVPFINGNLELVVLVDRKNNLEIVGSHYTLDTFISQRKITTVDEGVQLAKKWEFPKQGIIVRKHKKINKFIEKNIESEETLRKAIKKYLSWPIWNSVYLETDMRAHKNPSRMEAIKKATENLVENIKSTCPKCKAPGFVTNKEIKGLPCEICKRPTSQIKIKTSKCQKCGFKKEEDSKTKFANPKYCESCNR